MRILPPDREAIVCFESTGGEEWQLWTLLKTEGVAARQVRPAQVKAFAQSRRAVRPIGSKLNSSLASSYSGPKQAGAFL